MLKELQLSGFILGVLSWIGSIGTCASPEWRKNSYGRTLIDNVVLYDGLWLRCKKFINFGGKTQCEPWIVSNSDESIAHKNTETTQMCKMLVVTSLCVGFAAVIVTSSSLKCVTIGSGHVRCKSVFAAIGGFLFLCSAILTGTSASFFAQTIVQEYYNPTHDNSQYLRYEYGYALFIGWATLVLGIISSLLVIVPSILQFLKKGKAPQQGNPSILNKLPMHSLAQQRLPVAAVPQPPNRHVTIETATPRTPRTLSWKRGDVTEQHDVMNQRRRRRRSWSSDDSRSSRNHRRKEKVMEAVRKQPQQGSLQRGGSLRSKEYV